MLNQDLAAQPLVRIDDGRVVTESRDVAESFEKRHDNVLRDIDNLIADVPGAALKFEEGSYIDENNQQRRCFVMDRDGFTLLAMGFQGAKAGKWKLLYIEAFNAMEAQLKSNLPIEFVNQALQDIRDNTAAVRCRFDYHDKAIVRVETKVELLSEDIRFVKNHICKGRRNLTANTKRIHISDLTLMGGRCPCCSHAMVIDADGMPSKFAEWDHFFENSNPGPNATWFICKPCHSDLTTGRVPRDQRGAQFRAYQENRRRLPGRTPKLFD